MRILVFSWRDPKHPLAGGAEQVMHEHMKGWIKVGFKVTLFSSKTPNLKPEENIDGVRIIRKGSQYIGVQIAALFFYLKNKDSFDFIVDQFHGLPFFTPIYSKKPRVAIIQETARKVWFLNQFPFPLNILIGTIGFILEPLFFLFYKKTHFATGSMSAKIDVSKMGIPTKNISVWPHGVIVKSEKVRVERDRKKTIIFLGVLSKDKGIVDAIKCFRLLSKMNSDYQFWVIGKPESIQFGKYIKKIAKNLKLEKKIKFWGYVSQIKKFELLKKGHILINPSVREGWGLVNIEANRMGVPVVAYKAAGLIDSVKNNYSGVFCKVNTYEEMARVVNSLLNNEPKYKRLSRTSVIWSKKFSWEISVKISLKIILRVAKIHHQLRA